MHRARVLRGELEVVFLLDRQRVHVGPDRERAPSRRAHEPGDHAGFRWTGELQTAERFQRLVDELRGVPLVVGDLRVAVQVPPPTDDFFPNVSYEVVEGYGCDGFAPS